MTYAASSQRLLEAFESAKYTGGSTHNFYLYPARFSPEIARAVIDLFSEPGDCVLDPFMGGGTSIIEGLMLGRSMVGVDINALACFVASTRTRPLSAFDEKSIRSWARRVGIHLGDPRSPGAPYIDNLPRPMREFFSRALAEAQDLAFPRQRAFARCVLLRVGQWALDCKEGVVPARAKIADKLQNLIKFPLELVHVYTRALLNRTFLSPGKPSPSPI